MPARKLWLILFSSLTALNLAACADMGFPQPWELDRLRVLALQADKPEVNTNDLTFTITPYISDTQGEGRALTYTIQACYDPAVLFGADPDCANHLEALLGPAVTRTGTLGLPPVGATGAGTAQTAGDFTFTIPVQLLAAFDPTENALELNNGIPYSVVFTLTDPLTNETVTSFRRISVTTRTTLNQNPTITGVFTTEDAAITAITTGTEEVELIAQAADGAAETYIALSRDGSSSTLTEELTFSWLTNSGELSLSRTEPGDEVTYTPPTPEQVSSGEVDAPFFWVFLRDDRGGVSALSIPTAVIQ